jgi:hypothetical protein
VWFLPVVSLGLWLAYEALRLLLERTWRKDEYKRGSRFKATCDLATKFFRRPTYPLEPEHGPEKEGNEPLEGGAAPTENTANGSRTNWTVGLDNTEKRGWFRRKKTDDVNGWKEQVITII